MTYKIQTYPIVQPEINLTDVLTLVIQEIRLQIPLFSHLDPHRMLVCLGSNRSGSRGATYGKLVPLRFRDGLSELRYRGRTYTMPSVIHNGIRQLYVVYFYKPRFFDLPALEKLRVIFHELYHISPDFNGDIRRMADVKAAHGGSKRIFNRRFEKEVQRFHLYISQTPYIKFLSMGTSDLQKSFRKIRGRRLKIPRPVAGKIL